LIGNSLEHTNNSADDIKVSNVPELIVTINWYGELDVTINELKGFYATEGEVCAQSLFLPDSGCSKAMAGNQGIIRDSYKISDKVFINQTTKANFEVRIMSLETIIGERARHYQGCTNSSLDFCEDFNNYELLHTA